MTDETAAELPNPNKMLRWEQQIGYGAAGISAGGAVLIIASNDVPRGVVALVAAIGLVFAVRHGHRVITSLVGLPSLLLGAAPVEIVVLVYLSFLMFRTSNAQRRVRRSQPRMSAAERRAASDQRVAERRAQRRGAEPPATKSPVANRRYTPPRAKPARPPAPAAEAREPSRRDRILGRLAGGEASESAEERNEST